MPGRRVRIFDPKRPKTVDTLLVQLRREYTADYKLSQYTDDQLIRNGWFHPCVSKDAKGTECELRGVPLEDDPDSPEAFYEVHKFKLFRRIAGAEVAAFIDKPFTIGKHKRKGDPTGEIVQIKAHRVIDPYVVSTDERAIIKAARDENELRNKHLRAAHVICLNGIMHEHQAIAALPGKMFQLLAFMQQPDTMEELRARAREHNEMRKNRQATREEPLDKENEPSPVPLKSLKVVSFNPAYDWHTRLIDAYQWNSRKTYISPEMKDAAEQIWQNKFLDDHGNLIPLNEFNGFCFLTYSFGARMSFMIENELRERLLKKLIDDTKSVQEYFDKIKRVSIASAVDVGEIHEHFRLDTGLTDIPTIETLHIISQKDRGIAYWDKFYKCFMRPTKQHYNRWVDEWISEDGAYACIPLNQRFPSNGVGHHALLITSKMDKRVGKQDMNDLEKLFRMNDNGHGLSRYMIYMQHVEPEELLRIHRGLTIGWQNEHHVSPHAAGEIEEDQRTPHFPRRHLFTNETAARTR